MQERLKLLCSKHAWTEVHHLDFLHDANDALLERLMRRVLVKVVGAVLLALELTDEGVADSVLSNPGVLLSRLSV